MEPRLVLIPQPQIQSQLPGHVPGVVKIKRPIAKVLIERRNRRTVLKGTQIPQKEVREPVTSRTSSRASAPRTIRSSRGGEGPVPGLCPVKGEHPLRVITVKGIQVGAPNVRAKLPEMVPPHNRNIIHKLIVMFAYLQWPGLT